MHVTHGCGLTPTTNLNFALDSVPLLAIASLTRGTSALIPRLAEFFSQGMPHLMSLPSPFSLILLQPVQALSLCLNLTMFSWAFHFLNGLNQGPLCLLPFSGHIYLTHLSPHSLRLRCSLHIHRFLRVTLSQPFFLLSAFLLETHN